jgi:hypothetical protein
VCIHFFKPGLLFCGFLINYVLYGWAHIYIINASFYIIRLYEIHKISLKLKYKLNLDIFFRYITNVYIYFIKNKNLIVSRRFYDMILLTRKRYYLVSRY